MTFDEILANVRKRAAKATVSPDYFLAVMITITGDNDGVFYIEAKNGKVSVEPYEYIDRNCEIIISAEDLVKLMDSKLDPVAAFSAGKLKVNGDLGKALEFSSFIKKTAD
jgi:putative sterol carrier protein